MSGEFYQNKWLFFESYVKLVIADRVLVYNTLTGEVLENDDPVIVRFIADVTRVGTESLFSLGVETLATHPPLLPFLETLFSRYMIEVIPMDSPGERPFVFMPQVKINKDFLSGKGELYTGEGCYEYLKHLSVNLVRKFPTSKGYQPLARRQHLFFDSFGDVSEFLAHTALKRFCSELKNTHLSELSVVINPIDGHPALEEIMGMLSEVAAAKHFILDLDDAFTNGEAIWDFIRVMSSRVTVVIPFRQESEYVEKKINSLMEHLNAEFEALFLIGDEWDLERADKVMSSIGGVRVNCIPIFTGENLEFFKEFVFLRKTNIFSKIHSYNDLFCNETLNRSAFGHLYIDAAGECYGDLGENPIGNIACHNLGQIIFKELCEGEAWKRTRKKSDPCSNCIYNLFCPPISNYELAMNRNNLCHLRG